jgi:DNA invertase Pin-like site-specific DNA recombinase
MEEQITPTACAIYLRVSLDATGEHLAIERQREDCEKIAADRGWRVVETYIDNSVSASSKSKSRPAYERMVADHRGGRFRALVCWDLDRLTRQPRQLEDWIDAAEETGLILVTANGEADLGTDGGRLFARIKASVARAEVERKSARQRRAAQQRADHGKAPSGVRLTGYSVDGDINPAEADLVRAMFDRFAAGDSLRGIAAWLDASAIRPRRAKAWNPSTVRTVLVNPRYAGRAVYCGQATGKAGQWEAIVDEPTFDRVQQILTDPRRVSNRVGTDRRHLGSGLYRCGVCGGRLRSHSGDRYHCPQGRGHVTRKGSSVDNYVQTVLRARLSRPDLADLLASDADDEHVRRLSAEVARLRGRLATVEADYDAGLIDGRRYAVAVEKVRAELGAAEAARGRLAGTRGLFSVVAAPDPVQAYDDAPLGTQRAVLDALASVSLLPAPRGPKFHPTTVQIHWRTGADDD